ncbi:hypothetical protein S83_033158, partial [Arachis hypogaea]
AGPRRKNRLEAELGPTLGLTPLADGHNPVREGSPKLLLPPAQQLRDLVWASSLEGVANTRDEDSNSGDRGRRLGRGGDGRARTVGDAGDGKNDGAGLVSGEASYQ